MASPNQPPMWSSKLYGEARGEWTEPHRVIDKASPAGFVSWSATVPKADLVSLHERFNQIPPQLRWLVYASETRAGPTLIPRDFEHARAVQEEWEARLRGKMKLLAQQNHEPATTTLRRAVLSQSRPGGKRNGSTPISIQACCHRAFPLAFMPHGGELVGGAWQVGQASKQMEVVQSKIETLQAQLAALDVDQDVQRPTRQAGERIRRRSAESSHSRGSGTKTRKATAGRRLGEFSAASIDQRRSKLAQQPDAAGTARGPDYGRRDMARGDFDSSPRLSDSAARLPATPPTPGGPIGPEDGLVIATALAGRAAVQSASRRLDGTSAVSRTWHNDAKARAAAQARERELRGSKALRRRQAAGASSEKRLQDAEVAAAAAIRASGAATPSQRAWQAGHLVDTRSRSHAVGTSATADVVARLTLTQGPGSLAGYDPELASVIAAGIAKVLRCEASSVAVRKVQASRGGDSRDKVAVVEFEVTGLAAVHTAAQKVEAVLSNSQERIGAYRCLLIPLGYSRVAQPDRCSVCSRHAHHVSRALGGGESRAAAKEAGEGTKGARWSCGTAGDKQNGKHGRGG